MEIFNIGPLELLFVLIITLIVMGPKDLDKNARKLGTAIYRFKRSSLWKKMRNFWKTAQDYSTQIVRDAGLEELQKEFENQSIEIKQTLGSVEWNGRSQRSKNTVIAEEDLFKQPVIPPPDAERQSLNPDSVDEDKKPDK